MKNAVLFKSLVDIIYFLHFIGLIGMVIAIPMGTINFTKDNTTLESWTTFHWLFIVLGVLAYVIFLRALFFLRKIARVLLSKSYFTNTLIKSLKKSGTNFLYSGIMYASLQVLGWVIKLYNGEFKIGYDSDLIIPLFLSIIGLFFIIQSKSLLLAKEYKEENELTV